jgi:hypothetical protein
MSAPADACSVALKCVWWEVKRKCFVSGGNDDVTVMTMVFNSAAFLATQFHQQKNR